MPVPYAGNPDNYPAEVPVLSGSDIPGTGPFNSAYEALADRTAWLRQRASSLQAVDWKPAFIASGGPGGADFGAMCWDYDGHWVLVTVNQGTPNWAAFYGNGLDGGAAAAWKGLGAATVTTNPVVAIDVCVDPASTGEYWLIELENIGGIDPYQITVWSYAPSTWTSQRVYLTTPALYNVSLCPFFPYLITAVASAANTVALSSTNDGGATWHDFNTGTPNFPAGGEWLLKTNVEPNTGSAGGMVLAIPGFAAFGPTTGVWKTTDGVTWTAAATLGMLPAGASIVGLAWCVDDEGPCWIAMAQTSVATLTVLRSSDGVDWTVQTPDQPFARVADMAAYAPASPSTVGPTLVCSLHDEATPYPSGQVFSIDGGLNWYPSEARLFANDVGSDGYTRTRVKSSGNGFVTFNSLWARFSALIGLPY